MASKDKLFRVSFLNQGKVYEVYAQGVSDGGLPGFILIDKLVFGERSTLVVDPAEEKIKAEFAGVSRSYLPMHLILRIDEVTSTGTSRIRDAARGNVSALPLPGATPGMGPDGGDL